MEKIIYGFYKSLWGEIIIGKSDQGVCWLGFMVDGYKGNGYDRMVKHLPDADFLQDDDLIKPIGDNVVTACSGSGVIDFNLDLRGTEFQKSVWSSLLTVPRGQVKTYGDIANDLGNPKSARAVGSAVGENPVSIIVPCHRIVQKSGGIGNFGWGVDLKRQILKSEGVSI
ncbi:MAG: methylated-DNA--[protein]-cysteine S-methyltransferase [Alphaproteobacteria bacterium]